MGIGRSRGPRVYEPYTSFDVLPTEYFNRRQCQPPISPQYIPQAPTCMQYGSQAPQSSIQMPAPQSQLVYRPPQQCGYQAPQSTQVFSKQGQQQQGQQQQSGQQQHHQSGQQYVQVKQLSSSGGSPAYAPSQIQPQSPQSQHHQQQQQHHGQQQQQPITRGSSGGLAVPQQQPPMQQMMMAPPQYWPSQPQRPVVYAANPQQMQSVPKFNQQPQVQVVGSRVQ